MSRQTGLVLVLNILTLAMLCGAPTAEGGGGGDELFKLPMLPPPEGYGTILISRTSVKKGMSPVLFSHSLHRSRFTCRVCHGELDFNMLVNSTPITEMANRRGKYCGACHNGKIAFKANGNCDRCHVSDTRAVSKRFSDMLNSITFTRASYGDGIDWVESLHQGVIKPRTFIKSKSEDIPFDKSLILEAEWNMIPPSVFSHKAHAEWLDCSNCHPDIFNIKKKGTAHFSMAFIIRGQFCGVCHLNVAFPMNDCSRCHPKNKESAT
jgi:c(7)-type cytochrome triheme protein